MCVCVCLCLFGSDIVRNISRMTVSELDVFESVSEVTDYVQIQLNDRSFVSLQFLRNLRLIQGKHITQ